MNPAERPSEVPILDLDPAEDATAHAEEPRTVLITGSAGRIGRKLRAAWADRYELIPLDRQFDPADPDLILADLTEWDEAWTAHFDEADVVVHLAAHPRPEAPWEQIVRSDLDALGNVLIAAAQAGVERVVFACSSHVLGGYRAAPGSEPIAADLPPRPDTLGGAAKLMDERIGKCFTAATGLTFVALRLGCVGPGANRPEDLPDDLRALWLADADLVQLFTRAVEAELEPGAFVVVHGVSRNPGMGRALGEATERLGYVPRDGAGE